LTGKGNVVVGGTSSKAALPGQATPPLTLTTVYKRSLSISLTLREDYITSQTCVNFGHNQRIMHIRYLLTNSADHHLPASLGTSETLTIQTHRTQISSLHPP